MPTDLKFYQTDDKKKEEGIWKPIHVGDIEVLFRSPQSRTFQRIKEKVERRYAEKLRTKKMTQRDSIQMTLEYIVEGAILDWRNVLMEGEELAWSVDVGKEFLNPYAKPYGNEDLYIAVSKAFNDIEGYYRDEFEDSEKNSSMLLAIN